MYSTAKENCIMQGGVLPSDMAGSHNFIMHDIMEQDPEITHQIFRHLILMLDALMHLQF